MAIELEDGTIVRSLPEQVSKNLEDIIDLANRLAALKQQVEIGLSAALHYKGSVATYGDLPSTGNEIGDLWNVLDTGNNYAWTGSAWDEIGSSVDLSNYAQLSGLTNHFTNDNDFTGNVDFDGSIQTVLFGAQTTVLSNTGYEFADQDSQVATITHNAAYEEFTFYDVNSGHSVMFDFANERIYTTATSMDLGDSTYKFNSLYLGGTAYIPIIEDASSISFKINGVERFKLTGADAITGRMYPSINNTFDLGTSSYKWKDIYLSGGVKIGFGTLSYNNGFVFNYNIIPSSNNLYDIGASNNGNWKDGYFSGQVYAQNTYNIINSSDISGGVLTQEQYDLITNGKPTLIKGTGSTNTWLFSGIIDGANYIAFAVDLFYGNANLISYSIPTTGTHSFSPTSGLNTRLHLNGNQFNGKTIPAYPSSTGTFTLKCVDGVLTWVAG